MVYLGSRVELIMQAYQDSYAGKKHFKICEYLRSESLHCFRGSFLKNTLWGSIWKLAVFPFFIFPVF